MKDIKKILAKTHFKCNKKNVKKTTFLRKHVSMILLEVSLSCLHFSLMVSVGEIKSPYFLQVWWAVFHALLFTATFFILNSCDKCLEYYLFSFTDKSLLISEQSQGKDYRLYIWCLFSWRHLSFYITRTMSYTVVEYISTTEARPQTKYLKLKHNF
jgi:hypothetical protein